MTQKPAPLRRVAGTLYRVPVFENTVSADEVVRVCTDGGETPTLREERSLSEMRRTIATRLSESYREAVHVTIDRAADAERLLSAVEGCKRDLETDVSMLDLLLAALSEALDAHPEFNATFEDDVHSLYEEHNVGVAVDIDRGLVAPVVTDIGEKSLADIATERRRLTERVLSGQFSLGDLQGGTFTVTNLGPFGVESFDPVINPPQVASLGVNAIRERAVSGDGTASGVQFRRELPLSLSFDHRVVDGADAARFLGSLVEHLEHPGGLLPEGVELADRDGSEVARAERGSVDRAESERDSESPVQTPVDQGEQAEMPGRSLSAQVEGSLAGEIRGGSFAWSFDEPVDMGGEGAAPTPVDYFLGSLAACLAASIRYQADKRELAVEAIQVDVDGTPEHGTLESVAVTVGFESDAGDEELAHIVDLGERGCYVAATVREDLPVDLSWVRL